MANDDWVELAMSNDTLVADFLVGLKHNRHRQPSSSAIAKLHVLPPLNWGHRRMRSKRLLSVSAKFFKKNLNKKKKTKKDSADSARGSPTTPLSWSGGGASPSENTGDGFEESSRFNSRCVFSSRSKAAAAALNVNDSNATNATTSKSYTTIMTFAQLKEQEAILLEGAHFKKDIAAMHASLVEQRAKNGNLERIKLDFGLLSPSNYTTAAYDKPKETLVASTSTSLLPAAVTHLPASGFSQQCSGESSQRNRGFVLPDLNMMPSEEDSGLETTL